MLRLLIALSAFASIQSIAFGIPANLSDFDLTNEELNAIASNRIDPEDFELPAEIGNFDLESQEFNATDFGGINQVAALSPYRPSTQLKEFSIIALTKVNWFNAQQLCSAHGLTLVSITSRAEAAQLQKYIIDLGLINESFWTSGNNLSGLNGWFWMSNGKALTYQSWALNQPDNAGGSESCLELWPYGRWNDRYCYASLYFICENRCPLSSYEVPLYPPFK